MSNKEAIRILAKWLKDATKDCTGDMLGYVDGWFTGYDIDAFVQAIQALKVVDTLSTLIEQGKVESVSREQLKQVLDEYMVKEGEAE